MNITNHSTINKYNTTDQNKSTIFNRCRIEWMRVLKPYTYVILDYMLYRLNHINANNGEGWTFHVREIAESTNISPMQVSRTLKTFDFVQKEGHTYNMKLTIDRTLLDKWIKFNIEKKLESYKPCNPQIQACNPQIQACNPQIQACNPQIQACNLQIQACNPGLHRSSTEILIRNNKELLGTGNFESLEELQKVFESGLGSFNMSTPDAGSASSINMSTPGAGSADNSLCQPLAGPLVNKKKVVKDTTRAYRSVPKMKLKTPDEITAENYAKIKAYNTPKKVTI